MSRERALKAINLENTDKIPQLEVIDNPDFIKLISGIDPYEKPLESFLKTIENLDIDMIYNVPTESRKFEPDETQVDKEAGLSYTQWGLGGTPWHIPSMTTVDEILRYDPAKFEPKTEDDRRIHHLAMTSVSEIADEFSRTHCDAQRQAGNLALVPGVDWHTLIHYASEIFKWDNFFIAALESPIEFKGLLERFAKISIKISKAWAMTDIDLFVSHDDIAMSNGPLFSPDWYRENVFPWYKEIWKPIKDAGKKVLFISDGDISLLIDDLVEAGVDGFVLDSMIDLKSVIEKYGGTKILVGNVDAKVLTLYGEEEIEAEVQRCLSAAYNCPGYFLGIAGGIPYNIPVKNLETYFNVRNRWKIDK